MNRPPAPIVPATMSGTRSDLEAAFITRWRQFGGPELVAEYRFAPPRRWRFDFAHLSTQTAVELDGGTWAGGRHTRGAGFAGDCEKGNTAMTLGWAVYHLTTDMLATDPAGHLTPIIERIRGDE